MSNVRCLLAAFAVTAILCTPAAADRGPKQDRADVGLVWDQDAVLRLGETKSLYAPWPIREVVCHRWLKVAHDPKDPTKLTVTALRRGTWEVFVADGKQRTKRWVLTVR